MSTICIQLDTRTCSALRPGGHQAYSSRAHPESSSLFDERECCCWGCCCVVDDDDNDETIILFFVEYTTGEINWPSAHTLNRRANEWIQNISSNSSCLNVSSLLSNKKKKKKRGGEEINLCHFLYEIYIYIYTYKNENDVYTTNSSR